MFPHLLAADGRIGVPHTGKEQAHVVVNFRRRAHGGARISARHLLFDGYRGRDALDVVALGLLHTPQELAGIGRQTLHVAPLPFGIQCVEGQARLAASAHARNDNKLVTGNFQIHVLQVVHPCAFYLYAVFHTIPFCNAKIRIFPCLFCVFLDFFVLLSFVKHK